MTRVFKKPMNALGCVPEKRAGLPAFGLRGLCVLAAALALQSAIAWGQIVLDGTAATGSRSYGSNFTLTYGATATSNNVLIVGVSLGARSSYRGYVAGVTFQVGSQPVQSLTCRAAIEDNSATGCGSASLGYSGRVEIWSLANPQTGGSGTVTVNLTSQPNAVAGAISYSGVDLTQGSNTGIVTVATNRGASGAPSTTVTTTNNYSVVVDAVSSLNAQTVGASQAQIWNYAPTARLAGSSAGNGTASSVTMAWSGSTGWWAQAAVVLKPAAATLITLNSFTATPLDGGVLLNWRSGREVSNLGYHVYRDGVRVTSSPVAGSALIAGPETVLTAGGSYSWFDPDGTAFSSYTLEDIDIHGARTMHGPALPTAAPASNRQPSRMAVSRSPVAGRLGRRATAPSLASRAPAASKKADPDVEAALTGAPAVKLRVTSEGWYRVDASQLVAAGMPANADPRRLQLFAEGVEQAIVVSGESKVSAIEFYGTGIDTTFTATRVYWLTWNGAAGERAQTSSARGDGAAPASYTASLTWQPRTLYFPALLNGDADNFFGPVLDGADPVSQSFPVTHLASGPGSSTLTVTMQGASDGPHAVIVSLNGTDLGTITLRNQESATATFTFLSSLLKDGENTLRLSTPGADDFTVVDTVTLTYPHSYTADGDSLRLTAPAGARVTVGGFCGQAIQVIDITDPARPILTQGEVSAQASGYAVTFGAPGAGERTLLAFMPSMKAAPSIAANQPSSWRSRQAGADMVIVSHAAFIDSVTPLLKLRQQAHTVAVVDVEDLYDEFNFGEQSPYAIKDFLANANSVWVHRPKWVLLVGDGSYDPKNYLQTAQLDWMPVQLVNTAILETASDDWFADFDNDGMPEMAVGRLPVNSPAEASALVSRIVAYEKANKAAWKQKALLVAGIDDSENPFSEYAAAAKASLPPSMSVETVLAGRDANAREAVLSAVNAGVGLVDYAGHGSQQEWLHLMDSAAAEALTNGAATPFVAAMTCLNGFFHDVWAGSLAEAFLSAREGGAVAVWASSGLTGSAAQAVMNQAMLKAVYASAATLGEAIIAAKQTITDPDVRSTWILFGDPAMELR